MDTRGASFGTVIGDSSASGRAEPSIWPTAQKPSPSRARRSTNSPPSLLHVVVGLIQAFGTTLYCASVTIDDAGAVVGKACEDLPTPLPSS